IVERECQLRHQVLERTVLQASALIETVVGDVAEISFGLLHHGHVEKYAGLANLVIRAEAADASRRSRYDSGGLSIPNALPIRPRADVDRILEDARDAAIIFGTDEQDSIGSPDLVAEPNVRLGLIRKRVIVLVVERQVADLDHGAVEIVATKRADRAGHPAVETSFPKAADDDRDLVGHLGPPLPLAQYAQQRKVATASVQWRRMKA